MKGSEDKELSDLVKKIEDSYILKGLDWFEKKTKLKDYFPESKVAKGFDGLRDFLVYGHIGFIPGDKQEQYTKHLGYDKLKFTKYSITYGFCLGGVKIGLAVLSSPLLPVSASLWALGILTLADDSARLSYLLATKKPVGISYIEIPYRLGKHILKKKKKQSIKTESKNLNSSKFLNLS